MGLKCSLDFAQAVMVCILRVIDNAYGFIDEEADFLDDWDSHVKLSSELLRRLQENDSTVNPSKCEWAVKWSKCWLLIHIYAWCLGRKNKVLLHMG